MWAADVSIDIPRLPELKSRPNLTWFHAGASAFAALVMFASVLTWNWSRSIDGVSSSANGIRLAQVNPSNSYEAAAARLAASDEDDFFGIPIGSGSVGLVIDDHDRLASYTKPVARLTYAASDFARNNGAAMTVVEARVRGAGLTDAEADPFYAFSVLRIKAARKRLDSEVPAQSYLSTALSMTAPSSPEQIFVVISQPLSGKELGDLESEIRSIGVPVHMICLGDAANVHYGPLAAINGGKFIPVTDNAIEDLVNRCEVAMPARAR